MKPFMLPLIVFALIVALLGVGLSMNTREIASPLVGKPAPAFEAEALHDPSGTVSLDDVRGQVVAVNIWASWCPPCLEEHPYVMALANEIPVYGINYKDERADARAWLAQHGDSYAASAYDPSGRVGLDWGVYGVPETYLLDAQGVIRYKHVGVITERDLTEQFLPRVRRLREEKEQ